MGEQIDKNSLSYKCVNVELDLSPSTPDVNELLGWVNECLDSDYRRIQELANGVAYARLIELLFPGTVPLGGLKFNIDKNPEHDSIQNFNLAQEALRRVDCNHEVPVDKLVRTCFSESLEFLHWFKKFYDANCEPHTTRDRLSINNRAEDFEQCTGDTSGSGQLVVYQRAVGLAASHNNGDYHEFEYSYDKSLIDHAWSRRILELVANKSKLMESFSWLSTVGGGFSALGERDNKFSARAGALSLGQQLRLAELLGDERLKVMCHLFAAMAALQLDNKWICLNYIRRVIIPLMNAMPYRDPILTNILKHICFRISAFDRLIAGRQNAIEESRRHLEQTEQQSPGSNAE